MSQKHTGPLAAILVVLAIAILCIVDPVKLFNPHLSWGEKTYLKPGIDIAGGTSLLYEIKTPPGGWHGEGMLSEAVAAALKKRVDPNGVRNLVWRPQGPNRLEIQIPRSLQSDRAAAVQQEFADAGQTLDALNVRTADVTRAIEKLKGDARAERLKELAAGSTERDKLFGAMRAAYDQIQDAKAKGAAAEKTGDNAADIQAAEEQLKAEKQYNDLQSQVDGTNLHEKELKNVLDMQPSESKEALAALKAKFAGFPRRLAAIDQYVKASEAMKSLNGAIEGAPALKRLLKGSGVLEFHMLVDPDQAANVVVQMKQRMQPNGAGPARQGGDETQWFLVDRPDEADRMGTGHPEAEWNGRKYILAWITPSESMVHPTNPNEPNWSLTSVRAGQDQNGMSAVDFEFDPEGAKLFSAMTGSHLPHNGHAYAMAIVLDDKIISAPNIQSQINGRGIITGGEGGFSPADLRYLVNTLSAGSLPAQLAENPISERTVSPQLGQHNLMLGLVASAIGLVVVTVFLCSYYYLAGVVATFAVYMNLIIILGVLSMFGATFTLPSIAALVLTLGTAVDANVLVFERLREEQHRGLSLRMALHNAYDRAFSAIVDSNMTTVITSFFLYAIGTEEVKGFGLTLLIGIASSMFTALVVTRVIFAVLIDDFDVRDLSSIPRTFPKWDKLLRPNIDWMAMIWPFVIFSAIFISLGMSAFVHFGRNMYDIEFASGTSVVFDLKPDHEMTQSQVLERFEQEDRATHHLPSPSVVSINNSKTQYELVTPNDDSKQVGEAVKAAMGTDLRIETSSKFENFKEKDIDALMPRPDQAPGAATVMPITSENMTVDGFDVPDAARDNGGVMIVLRHLSPALTPAQIKDRIVRASVQPGSETSVGDWQIDVDRLDGVTGPKALTTPASDVAVLASDVNFPYAKSEGDWKANLAAPLWKLIDQGINREAEFQQVSNFNPQVAGDMTRDALMATVLSIIVIMIYIWVRFANLKYGTATIVALLHDTLFVIGAIGLSHYLANTHVGDALLIEPFRINLTLVAAILTIMGYSMIDTIVVFDRIRENRGKYGVISRKVINDSVNQTLSRTLLTAGTTLSTVAVMYFAGGPGIHGFTFVLLVGILCGTYSSIAIAAPILLLGGDRKAPAVHGGQRQVPRDQTQRVGA